MDMKFRRHWLVAEVGLQPRSQDRGEPSPLPCKAYYLLPEELCNVAFLF